MEAQGIEEFESCFVFTALPNSETWPIRDVVGTKLLERIAALLRAQGFTASKVKEGKPRLVGFRISFDSFFVEVALFTRHHGKEIECALLTWIARPFLRRILAGSLEKSEFDRWSQSCAIIAMSLNENSQDFSLSDVVRLTRKEAEGGLAHPFRS